MANMITSLKAFKYFNELAFVVALLLILFAWKFVVETVAD